MFFKNFKPSINKDNSMKKLEDINMIREFLMDIFSNEKNDGVSFYHTKTGDLIINSVRYITNSIYKKSNEQQYYHILLYKINDKQEVTECDLFDAILLDPGVYIRNMIRCKWFGFVGKVTENSPNDIQELYTQIKNCIVPST